MAIAFRAEYAPVYRKQCRPTMNRLPDPAMENRSPLWQRPDRATVTSIVS